MRSRVLIFITVTALVWFVIGWWWWRVGTHLTLDRLGEIFPTDTSSLQPLEIASGSSVTQSFKLPMLGLRSIEIPYWLDDFEREGKLSVSLAAGKEGLREQFVINGATLENNRLMQLELDGKWHVLPAGEWVEMTVELDKATGGVYGYENPWFIEQFLEGNLSATNEALTSSLAFRPQTSAGIEAETLIRFNWVPRANRQQIGGLLLALIMTAGVIGFTAGVLPEHRVEESKYILVTLFIFVLVYGAIWWRWQLWL